MDTTQRIHEKILDFLIKENKKNPDFYFATRIRNTYERLDKGYWFQGNNGYVYVSFWEGGDSNRRVRNIGFVVNSRDKNSWIELSAKGDERKIPFMEIVANKLGFYKGDYDGVYYKEFEGNDYINNLKLFLQKEKKEIDKLIEQYNPEDISIINKSVFERYKPIIQQRLSQIEYGEQNKIVRLCWNTNRWKFPSGSNRLKQKPKSYVEEYGFGHEEWLFDRSKIIGEYHYAFIQAFNLETDRHVGQVYNIKLYTINPNTDVRYYVGYINRVEGISEQMSEQIYQTYKSEGWISEMKQQVKCVGGEWNPNANYAQMLFNIKFRFEDAVIFDQYEAISQDDINITSDHFVLLPLKSEIEREIEEYSIDDVDNEDTSEGNYKNTEPRTKVINQDVTYDPYHDKMQNALHALLKQRTDIYELVQIEKSRVDLKAKTTDGDWHYFELKTDSAKLSIRKAIGQIMEYAYYPNNIRASKLIIISDNEPTDGDINYINHIRKNFNIPVFYRYFKLDTNFLSEEY